MQENELVSQAAQKMTRKCSSENDVVRCIPETQMPPPIHDNHWSSHKDTVEFDKYEIQV